MCLSVPSVQVKDIAPAVWLYGIGRRIRTLRRAEHGGVFGPSIELERFVDGMAGLVPQYAQRLDGGGSFGLQHEPALKTDQARMRKIERYCETHCAVGVEPFFGQPGRGTRSDTAPAQFREYLTRALLDRRARKTDGQITKANAEQFCIG